MIISVDPVNSFERFFLYQRRPEQFLISITIQKKGRMKKRAVGSSGKDALVKYWNRFWKQTQNSLSLVLIVLFYLT